MKRLVLLVAVPALAVLLSAGACARMSPCAQLPPPTNAEVSVARSGAEVSRDIQRVECDLVVEGTSARWVVD